MAKISLVTLPLINLAEPDNSPLPEQTICETDLSNTLQ